MTKMFEFFREYWTWLFPEKKFRIMGVTRECDRFEITIKWANNDWGRITIDLIAMDNRIVLCRYITSHHYFTRIIERRSHHFYLDRKKFDQEVSTLKLVEKDSQ